METYYKVVKRLKNGDRVSAITHKNSGLRETYLHHGQPIPVKQGFVFPTFQHCNDWITKSLDEGCCEIWECIVKNTYKPSGIIYGLSYSDAFLNKQEKFHLQEMNGSYAIRRQQSFSYIDRVFTITCCMPNSLMAENIVITKLVLGMTVK